MPKPALEYRFKELVDETTEHRIIRCESVADHTTAILKLALSTHETALPSIEKEYAISKNLIHNNVIKIIGLVKFEGAQAIVEEDIPGQNLKQYLQAHDLTVLQNLHIAHQCASAVAYVHQCGIIHQDIQSPNFLVDLNDANIKIVDFSDALKSRNKYLSLDSTDQPTGALAYMAPEQTGKTSALVDGRADLYSLGVVLYEVFTRELPFHSDDPLEFVHKHIALEPVNPCDVQVKIPLVVSDIILKLLNKNPDQRYQSGYGLVKDLQQCIDALKQGLDIQLQLGLYDHVSILNSAPSIVGRNDELAQVHQCYEEAVNGGFSSLFVQAKAGIGKSMLIDSFVEGLSANYQLNSVLYLKGKFQSSEKALPYSAIAEILFNYTNQMLNGTQSDLLHTRGELSNRLGNNAQLLLQIEPRFKFLLDNDGVIPSLGVVEGKTRIHYTLTAFFNCLSERDNPLIVLLDDLQWVDPESLDWLLSVMHEKPLINCFFIVACRAGDEASFLEPLVKVIRSNGNSNRMLRLGPLTLAGVEEYIRAAISSDRQNLSDLALQLYQKSGGNPLYLQQSLRYLYDNNGLYFDCEQEDWCWNEDAVAKLGVKEDVIELVIHRLNSLDAECLDILKLAACRGNIFTVADIKFMRSSLLVQNIEQKLSQAKDAMIVESHVSNRKIAIESSAYSFVHDRLSESILNLITADEVKANRYILGRAYLSEYSHALPNDRIAEIAALLNETIDFMDSAAEKKQLVELNLKAGKILLVTAAYESTYSFYSVAKQLMEETEWENDYELMLEVHKCVAFGAYATGRVQQAHDLCNTGITKSRTAVDSVDFHMFRILLFMAENNWRQAVKSGLLGLSLFDIKLDGMDESVLSREVDSINAATTPAALKLRLDRPKMSDVKSLAVMKLLNVMISPVYVSMPQMAPVLLAKMVQLSLDKGDSLASAHAYANYAFVVGTLFGDFQKGERFAKLAKDLDAWFGQSEFSAKTIVSLSAVVLHWTNNLVDTIALLKECKPVAIQYGDLVYAGYAGLIQLMYRFSMGDPIERLIPDLKAELEFVKKTNNPSAGLLSVMLFACNRLGQEEQDRSIGSFLTECEPISRLFKESGFQHGTHFYNFSIMQVLYILDESGEALEFIPLSENALQGAMGQFSVIEHYYYKALILLSVRTDASIGEDINECLRKLKHWSKYCPGNCLHKYQLIQAECYRVKGQLERALDFYDRAINSAKTNQFLVDEAISSECAFKYWIGIGKHEFAAIYFKSAWEAYTKWGAKSKLRLMASKYPGLYLNCRTGGDSSSNNFSDIFDMRSVLKAVQLISKNIDLDELLKTVVGIILENAGARKGVLFLNTDQGCVPKAWADVAEDNVQKIKYPSALVSMVEKTLETIVGASPTAHGVIHADPYLENKKPQSYLCMPIFHKKLFVGILYLENELIPNIFKEGRLEAVRLILAQVGISFETATLIKNISTEIERRKIAQEELRKHQIKLEDIVKERTTELGEAQEALVRQERLATLGQLTSTVSHELRNPLAAIKASVFTLEKLFKEPDERSVRSFERLERNINRCDKIIDELLDYTKIGSLEKSKIKLDDWLQEVIEEQTFEPGISVELVKGMPGVHLVVDSNRLQRAVINVFENALHAVRGKKQGGTIIVSTGNDAGMCSIKFRDNGVGMSEETKEKIFEPLFSTRGFGVGLGMSTVRQIIKLHKGEIKVDSIPDQGSIVELQIPLG